MACVEARETQRISLASGDEPSNFDNSGFSPAIVGAMLLANTLLGGSGMLGIPHAFSVAGWGVGFALLIFSGVASAFGCHLLQCSARKIGEVPCSFYSVARATVPRWTWLIDGAVTIKCFGVGTSYLIIVGDLLPDVATHFGLTGNATLIRRLAVTIGFALGGPLACLKNLSGLRFTSFGTVAIVFWTLLLIVLFFLQVMDPCANEADARLYTHAAPDEAAWWEHEAQRLMVSSRRLQPLLDEHTELPCHGASFQPVGSFTSNPVAILKVFPVFIFGFTCHQNIFSICNEVRNATQKRVYRIILAAYTVAGASFLVSALLGYATYGQYVSGDVLQGYPQYDSVEITRFLFSFVAIFSYPLQIHPARICAMNLWKFAFPRHTELDDRVLAMRYWIVTAILLVGSLGIALVTKSLGLMLAIVGATGSTMVSYILPGLVYWCSFQQSSNKRFLALAQLCIGCVIMPTCLIAAFL